ncbi:hypothetical protein FACS189450_08830 [Spirochaetia bacterium]|nr:hypothetical protein FACS189450_08830 [Spirochaetia bacterium]
MEKNNSGQTSFWGFLNSHAIEIPIIQRDYAQGRIGKEKLRELFLKDLKDALDNDDKTLKLDFVYGSKENGNLNPLDGQQRLTTLWLLHWYIAYKSNNLTDDNKKIFKRFDYETRVSSREFCLKLAEFTDPITNGLVTYIQDQTWFYSDWKQDPTIQAMLNMLGGSPIKDSKENDILDGIEKIFKDCDYSKYWKKLTGDDCPIIFYYLDLMGLSLSDDLYIKMNARGKQLTSFENFKADLVGHINSKSEEWEKDKNPQDTIAHKLDTTWTDIFWKNRSPEYKIDEIYFAFLNRYFLNALVTAKKEDDYLFKEEKWEKDNKTFNSLYDTKEYSGFDIYNPKEGNYEVFQESVYNGLADTLNNFHESFKDKPKEEITCLFLPTWGDDKFEFIPKYEENPKYNEDKDQKKFVSTSVTQSQRVVFYAICCYFRKIDTQNQYHETTLKQWMRVVWNIVENANITNAKSMIGALRLIDDLANYSHVIYEHLKSREIEDKDFAIEQMKEEKEKAHKISPNNDFSIDLEWEKKIIDAENHAFFKGAIRFLFTDENGKINWDMFDEKLKNADNYFDEKGIKYKEKVVLLKSLISKTSDPWDTETLWWWPKIFNYNANTWKSILTNSKWKKAVSSILLGNLSIEDTSTVDWHKKLYKTDLLDFISEKLPFSWIRNIHGHTAIYQSSEGVFLNADHRDNILSQLNNENKIKILYGERIENTNLFWGWNISFQYNEKNCQWHETEKIYLLDSNHHRVREQDEIWFDTKGKDIDDITKELDNFPVI